MKKRLLPGLGQLCLCLLISTIVSAQIAAPSSVSGTVKDSLTDKSIEFGTAALLPRGKTQPIAGTITDAQGRYSLGGLEKGTYGPAISLLGYSTKTIRGIVLTE